MGFIDKFRDGGTPKLPPREEQTDSQQQTQPSSASIMSGSTAYDESTRATRTINDERVHRSMTYLNLPTATEREVMRRKAAERQARGETDKKESAFRKKFREITNVSALGGGGVA